MKTNRFKIEELYTSTISLKTKILVILTLLSATMAVVPVRAATQPWGTALGSFNGVENYSNGSGTYASGIYDYVGTVNVGLEWQCVEYVQRYYYSQYGLDLRGLSGGLNARDFFGHAANMQLTAYANGSTTAPQDGDILCFSETGSGLGHIAIIRAVDQANSKVHVIQQNVKNGDTSPNGYGTDVDWMFPYSVSGGAYTVNGSSELGSDFYCQGWLRKPSSGRLSAPTLSTPVNSATGVSTTPSFSWSQVSGDQGYRIIVSTSTADLPTDPTQAGNTPNNGFNQTVAQNTTSYTWAGTLAAGATYYWEVHALGTTLDQAGYWSSKNNFSTAQSTVPITFATSPSGLQITVDGTTYTTPITFNWTPGNQHSLGVPTPQYFGLYSRYQFNGAQNQTITTPGSTTTYTENFSTQYALTESAGTGGSVNSSGGWYDSGTVVSISATANSGYSFSSWTGAGTGSYYSGNSSSTSITMNGPIFETANFSPTSTYTINTSSLPSAGGTTSGDGSYISGSTVTVAAAENVGYGFVNWTEGNVTVSTSASYSFMVSANRTLVANFTAMCAPQPADINEDFQLTIDEIAGYIYSWRSHTNWINPPNPIPPGYVANALYLWAAGQYYHCDLSQMCPQCWVSSQPPSAPTANTLEVSSSFSVATGSTAVRTLPSTYAPAVPVDVSLSMLPDSFVLIYLLAETPPAGWSVTNINEGGTWDPINKVVDWVFIDGNPRTLTYQAIPPIGTSGAQLFSGIVYFNTNLTAITGASVVLDQSAVLLSNANLEAKLNFTKPNADEYKLTITPGVHSCTNLAGTAVSLDVGGAQVAFTLDVKGRGVSDQGTCRLAYSPRTGVCTFSAKLSHGSWQTAWAAYGLVNATIPKPGVMVTLPVTLVIGDESFMAETPLRYTATVGKSGTAK